MDEQTGDVGARETFAQRGSKPNGRGPGNVPIPVIPPSRERTSEASLGVLVGPKIPPDGTSVVTIAGEAVDACREAWKTIVAAHADQVAKVNAIYTRPAAEMKARALGFTAQQFALRRADAALAELRQETKTVAAAIERKVNPPFARDDARSAILAMEIRSMLRAANASERMSLVERAIGADDVAFVSAALSQPLLSGLGPEGTAMLAGKWRRQRAPKELARLEALEQTSARVEAAAEALMRRYSESYDHAALDKLEAQTKAA